MCTYIYIKSRRKFARGTQYEHDVKVKAKARLNDARDRSYLPEEPTLQVTLAGVRVVYHVGYSILLLIRHRAMAVAVAGRLAVVRRRIPTRCRVAVSDEMPSSDDASLSDVLSRSNAVVVVVVIPNPRIPKSRYWPAWTRA